MLYTCITWATSGIGKTTAELFAAQWHHLILIWRRNERLLALKEYLQHRFQIDIILWTIDIRDHNQVEDFFKELSHQSKQIEILINNAWLAKWFDYLEQAKIDDIDNMIHTNITWLLYMSKYAIPLMKEKGKHIFNIGSISGKAAYASWVTYCATKAAVNMISECMRLELQKDNIFVTCINPWLVDTEFQLVRSNGDKQKIENFLSNKLWNGKQLDPMQIAQLIYENIGRNIPEISYRHKQ